MRNPFEVVAVCFLAVTMRLWGMSIYFAFGALIHWIAWGTAWFGVASFALLVLWPFFLFFWFWVVVVILVVVIGAGFGLFIVWEHYVTEPRRHRRRLNKIREQTIRYDHLNR